MAMMMKLDRWISHTRNVDSDEACRKAKVLCEEIFDFDKLPVDAKGGLAEEFVRISFNPDGFLPYSSFMTPGGMSTVKEMILNEIVSGIRSASSAPASHETFDAALKTARPSFYQMDEDASSNHLYRKVRTWYEMMMTAELMNDLIMSVLEPGSHIITGGGGDDERPGNNTFWLPPVSMDLARSLIVTPDIVTRALERI